MLGAKESCRVLEHCRTAGLRLYVIGLKVSPVQFFAAHLANPLIRSIPKYPALRIAGQALVILSFE